MKNEATEVILDKVSAEYLELSNKYIQQGMPVCDKYINTILVEQLKWAILNNEFKLFKCVFNLLRCDDTVLFNIARLAASEGKFKILKHILNNTYSVYIPDLLYYGGLSQSLKIVKILKDNGYVDYMLEKHITNHNINCICWLIENTDMEVTERNLITAICHDDIDIVKVLTTTLLRNGITLSGMFNSVVHTIAECDAVEIFEYLSHTPNEIVDLGNALPILINESAFGCIEYLARKAWASTDI